MSGGRVLRVVRMRFLHCFLSRHCDVCVLVAHRRQGAWPAAAAGSRRAQCDVNGDPRDNCRRYKPRNSYALNTGLVLLRTLLCISPHIN